jgi:hypothetical protein
MALTLGLLFFPHAARAEMPLELIAEFNASAGGKCLSPGDINADGYSEVFAFDAEISNRLVVYSGIDPQDTLPVMTIDSVQDYFWIADINADGYDDCALQMIKTGPIEQVRLYYGGNDFLDKTEPDLIFLHDDSISGNFGRYISSGDINGNGLNDLIIRAPLGGWIEVEGGYMPGNGEFIIYYGGASIDTIADDNILLYDYGQMNYFALFGTALGDINGDGLADLAFNYDNLTDPNYDILIIPGSIPLDTLPSKFISTPFDVNGRSYDFGSEISLLGDINRDGYDDFMVGGDFSWPCLYYGGDYPFIPNPIILGDTSVELRGSDQCANIGDINADGWDDIAVGNNRFGSSGMVLIYYGYHSISTEVNLLLNYSGSADIRYFGSSVGPAGDFNGDGIDDIAITALENTEAKSARGKLFIYAGSNLLPTSVTDTRDNPVPNNHWFLNQNHPNPFNIYTEITFSLTGDAERHVELNVYNILGQKVRSLTLGVLSPGSYVTVWNGCDDSGHIIGSGVYFCVLRSGDEVISRKMVCLK